MDREQFEGYSEIEHLSFIVWENDADRNERLMAMLTVYVDESRMDEGQAFPVVGGYLSTVERWLSFSALWKQSLRGAGVSCFHAAEFWSNAKGSEFEDRSKWTLDAKVALVDELMDILKCHAIQSIAVGVDNASYLEVVGDRKRFPNKHGSQYELCGFRTATMVGQWAEKHSPFPISFVFDQGNRYRHQLERGFEVVRRGPHSFTPYLGPITFASDERVAPLQAADLMAWTVGRTMYDEHVEHRNKPTAPWAARLWNLMPCMEGYFHRDLLISLRDEARYWHQENVRIDDRQTQKFLRAVKPASELLRRKD